jgi:hypothetical protein
VPISESEYQYRRQNGAKALEAALEREQIDTFNVYRTPAV